MFDRREKNIEVFENSVSMTKNNIKLKQSVTDSIRRQTVYLELDTIAIPENQNLNCKTVISQKRSSRPHLNMQEKVKKSVYLILPLRPIPVAG